ncbi:universal stress protein [Corynebacterium sp. LK2510]|uniref:universal stress protein n=1 Tax=Corynebacterium sp. LK2510 TaxID=3110472 RepID=UPI0034CF3AB3
MPSALVRHDAAQSDSGATSSDSEARPLRVAVGWSPSGSDSVAVAAWLGKSVPVTVSVFSTVKRKWTNSLSPKKYAKWLREETSKVTAAAKTILGEALPAAQIADEPCTIVDATDGPASLISSARKSEADIIVLGSGPKRKKARFSSSCPTDALLGTSPIPLGLVPTGLKLSKKGVTRVTFAFLYADQGTDTSGLAHAAMLAHRLDVPLRLLSVIPELPQDDAFDVDINAVTESPDWHEASLALLDLARDEAYRTLSELRGTDAADALVVERELAHGNGWKKAINSVKWKRGDLICLGSHVSAEPNCVDAGDRADSLLRHAPAPVLIYPRTAAPEA